MRVRFCAPVTTAVAMREFFTLRVRSRIRRAPSFVAVKEFTNGTNRDIVRTGYNHRVGYPLDVKRLQIPCAQIAAYTDAHRVIENTNLAIQSVR